MSQPVVLIPVTAAQDALAALVLSVEAYRAKARADARYAPMVVRLEASVGALLDALNVP